MVKPLNSICIGVSVLMGTFQKVYTALPVHSIPQISTAFLILILFADDSDAD